MADIRPLRPASAASRSPERQKLAATIERVTAAREALDRIRQARAKVGRIGDAMIAVEAAEAALAEARPLAGRKLVDALLGRGSAIDDPIAAAEAALVAAQREVEQRRYVHALLDDEERTTQAELRSGTDYSLARDLGAALAADPAVEALLAAYHSARARVDQLAEIISTLPATAKLDGWSSLRTYPLDPAPVVAWRAAVAALATNAATVLPGIGAVEPPAAA